MLKNIRISLLFLTLFAMTNIFTATRPGDLKGARRPQQQKGPAKPATKQPTTPTPTVAPVPAQAPTQKAPQRGAPQTGSVKPAPKGPARRVPGKEPIDKAPAEGDIKGAMSDLTSLTAAAALLSEKMALPSHVRGFIAHDTTSVKKHLNLAVRNKDKVQGTFNNAQKIANAMEAPTRKVADLLKTELVAKNAKSLADLGKDAGAIEDSIYAQVKGDFENNYLAYHLFFVGPAQNLAIDEMTKGVGPGQKAPTAGGVKGAAPAGAVTQPAKPARGKKPATPSAP